MFADKGIMAIEHANFNEIERLAVVGNMNIEVFKSNLNAIVLI